MKEDLTKYDIKPESFINYLRYYGEHFNRKLCEFACQQLGCSEYSKEGAELLLKAHNVLIENAKLYDTVYLINWCKKILFGSSISDEKHIVLFIKDIFDKEYDLVFNRWYADMAKLGIPIDWDEMI